LFKIHQLENQEAEEKVLAALQERDIAVAKVEEIKGLLEEIEQDRHTATDELEQSANILAEAKHQLTMAQVELETLRKELKIAEDKLHIMASTDAEGLAQENVKLNGELIDLHAQIIKLETEKQELDEKLMAYKEADSRVLEQAVDDFQNQEALLEEITEEAVLEKEEPLTELPETLIEPLEQRAAIEIPLIEEEDFVELIVSEPIELPEVQVEKKLEAIDTEQNSLILQQQLTTKEQTSSEDLWEKNAFKTAIEQAVAEELLRVMPAAKEGQKDDLKKINGIGYEIEKKLNVLGIVTYEQVAILNDSVLNNRIAMLLAAFDGNVERDQWVAQAKQLITKQKINNLTKDIKMTKLFRK
jgi:predicted flap endonuclease-1-like 5' DNA nuclease